MALTRPKIWDIDTNVEWFVDPLTVLHQGSTLANVDVGFIFNRANGLVSNVALYWNESAQSFVTAYTSSDGTTNTNVSVTSYANVTVGNVSTSGNITVGGSTPGIVTPVGSGSNLILDPDGSGNVYISANAFVNYTTQSTSSTTGALIVAGGVGIAGNLNIGGNITTGNITTSGTATVNKLVTTTGVFWSNGSAYSSGGGGTGITYTASTTAPSSPNVGDQWYYTTGDILYEYQNVGTGNFWVDITSGVVTSGTITVPGNADSLSPFLLMGA